MPNKRLFLITGPPGIGKTTIIKKISRKLSDARILTKGFYTQEIRNNGTRIGFDVVSLNTDLSKPLARLNDSTSRIRSPIVGKYAINVACFEEIVLPILINEPNVIYIIDEVGKMELFSKKFEAAVENLMSFNEITILATIPVHKTTAIPLVDKLRNNSSSKIYVVNRANRDQLDQEIFHEIKNAI